MRARHALMLAMFALGAVAIANVPAIAGLTPYDAPSISCVSSGEHELTVRLCAGASGAPAGLTLQWKTAADFAVSGWADDGTLCALSLSGQPSMQHPGASRWDLGPNGCETIIIGDINFDETGVSGTGCAMNPLDCGTDYVFRAFAHAGRGFGRSDWSADQVCSTLPCQACTYTQGYWKTHGPVAACVTGNNENAWPVSSLMLGNRLYSASELCAILNESAAEPPPANCTVTVYKCKGTGNACNPLNPQCPPNKPCTAYTEPAWQGANGLIGLAHQLIAAKLNVASGATCPAAALVITQADALIGSLVVPPYGCGYLAPPEADAGMQGLVTTLDQFNNGILADCNIRHCGTVQQMGARPATSPDQPAPIRRTTWGKVKTIYR